MSSAVADLIARLPAGAVTTASGPSGTGGGLPVLAELRPLFPGGELRRGSTVEVAASMLAPDGGFDDGRFDNGGAAGSWPVGRPADPDGPGRAGPVAAGGSALLLALLAGVSAAGSWCALVGAPGIGLAAAAEAGIDLARLALVPAPGARWSRAVGALVDGFDLVAVRPPPGLAAEARALSARARHHGAVLLSLGPWPGAEVRLAPVGSSWEGLGAGHGLLGARRIRVRAAGRGAAGGRPRSVDLWLPAPGGPIEAITGAGAGRGPAGVGAGREAV